LKTIFSSRAAGFVAHEQLHVVQVEEFRHVKPEHGTIAEEVTRKFQRQFRLPYSGRPEKQERAERFAVGCKPNWPRSSTEDTREITWPWPLILESKCGSRPVRFSIRAEAYSMKSKKHTAWHSWIGRGLGSPAFEPLTYGVIRTERDEPLRVGAIGIDRRHKPPAKRLFTMSDNGMELRELPQPVRLAERFDFLLQVVAPLPRGPAPRFLTTSRSQIFFDAMTAQS
jgi:hypothetical protein